MTEPSDLDDRLARLAARKARAATPTPDARRKHPAAAARILSLGLSSAAFFSMVAAFGQNTPRPVAGARAATGVPTVARPVIARPRTKVIVKYVHHTVFVDRAGRPITSATAAISTGNRPTAGAAPPRWTAPAQNAPAVGTPVAAPAAPTVPNAGAPAPAPAPAPRPTTPRPPVVTTPPPPAPPVCSGTQCP